MDLINLSALDLALTSSLMLLLALLSWRMQIGVQRTLLIATARSIVQLLILGLILKTLFNQTSLAATSLLAIIMLTAAGYEVMARQKHRFRGGWGIGIGTTSMFISSFGMMLFALLWIIQPTPWHTPQYFIPILGMLLGNTMSGVALSLDYLNSHAIQQKGEIEAQLSLGISSNDAISPIRKEAIRTGLIPIINAMASAGIVSLPGMMTGQILAGSPPMDAAKYQIMILVLITAGTALGSIIAVHFGSKRLFDDRQRLRLDRLIQP